MKLSFQPHPLLEQSDDFVTAAQHYHESTKVTRTSVIPLTKRVEKILGTPAIRATMMRAWKRYPTHDTLPLPPCELPAWTLEDVLAGRARTEGSERVTLAQLSGLLRFGYGKTAEKTLSAVPSAKGYLRAAPSAGGLYPLEIYPIILDVAGCAAGLYHYSVPDHALEVLRLGAMKDELLHRLVAPASSAEAAAMLVVSAVLPRTLSKYLFLGYRFLQYDAGALLQSLLVAAAGMGLGSRAIGGFYDDEIGDLVGVDNVLEQVVFLLGVTAPGMGGHGDFEL